MSELKTLRDFEIEAQKDVDNPGSYAWMNEANYEKEQGQGKLDLVRDLREEATIWITKLEDKKENFVAMLSGITEPQMKIMADTFRHFFNISDVDALTSEGDKDE